MFKVGDKVRIMPCEMRCIPQCNGEVGTIISIADNGLYRLDLMAGDFKVLQSDNHLELIERVDRNPLPLPG